MALSAGVAVAAVGTAAKVGTDISAANSASKSAKSAQAQQDKEFQQAQDFRQKAADLYDNLKVPSLGTDVKFQNWLQDYNPQSYTPYAGSMTQIQDNPEDRARYVQSLNQLQELAKGGFTPADIASLQQIGYTQQGAASSQAAAAQNQLRAQGAGGAGANMAAALSADQIASNANNNLYAQAFQAAMNRQLQAANSASTGAGNLRTQDVNLSGQMANIANAYNTQLQQLYTGAAKDNANIANTAQLANQTGRQGVANANTALQNQQIGMGNDNTKFGWNAALQKTQGQANAYGGQASSSDAQSAASAQQALGYDQAHAAAVQGIGNAVTDFTKSDEGKDAKKAAGNWFSNLGTPTAEQGTWD